MRELFNIKYTIGEPSQSVGVVALELDIKPLLGAVLILFFGF